MRVIDSEIRRTEPRTFWEFAVVILDRGEVIHRCHDHCPMTVDVITEGQHAAKRAVRKDGRPIGPFLLNFRWHPHGYYVDGMPKTENARCEP